MDKLELLKVLKYVIGAVAEKDHCPEFVKKEWNVEINSASVIVKCDGFSVAMFTRDGCDMIGRLPKSLGFTLDEDDAVKVVK